MEPRPHEQGIGGLPPTVPQSALTQVAIAAREELRQERRQGTIPEGPMIDTQLELARSAAMEIQRGYDAYQACFMSITRRGRERFEARDWRGAQQDANERFECRSGFVREVLEEIRRQAGDAVQDKRLWTEMKRAYVRLVAGRPDALLAETFFNSISRRTFTTVGVDPEVEFVGSEFETRPPPSARPIFKSYPWRGSTVALMRTILRDFAFSQPYQDLPGDAQAAADEIEASNRAVYEDQLIDSVEMVRVPFFRNKGAYLVGRIRRGTQVSPLVLALLHDEDGIRVDAVLLTHNDASLVFSLTHSYFRVETDRPRDLVYFLKSILPYKPVSEIYTALGHNKHGKTELYRELLRHLGITRERFELARGDRGMVMLVFNLPSLDVVFKIIKDRFAFPKSSTRQDVMSKYQLVSKHDRAGRLADAQEFEHLAFDKDRFTPELLEELEREAGQTVHLVGDKVVVDHLYTQRRFAPLNVYLRESDEWHARNVILDYGQSIRDLAVTNTFPGDLLLKNFGVTRTGRVVFYDYDELCLVTDCNFRDMPAASDSSEEMSAEPFFYVADNDVFPEEFIRFLGMPDRLKEAFLAVHGEILTADFWRKLKERHLAGEIFDIFPYKQFQRLRRRG